MTTWFKLLVFITAGYIYMALFVVTLPFEVALLPVRIFTSLKERWDLRHNLVSQSTVQVPEELSVLEMLRQILVAVRSARTQNSMQENSTFIKVDEWPKHLISIMDPQGRHRGFGSVIAGPNGRYVMLTARHVVESLKEGSILMGANKIALKVNLTSKWFRTTMDLAGIFVDPKIISQLGTKKLTLASTPGTGTAVSVYGYYQGSIVRAIGVVESPDSRLKFKHTCSAIGGFSGSPLIRGDKSLVGLHIEECPMGYNYGLSLDFLVRKLNSPGEGQRDRRLFGQFDEELTDMEDEDYLAFDDDSYTVLRQRGQFYSERSAKREEEHLKMLAAGQRKGWADEENDEDYFNILPVFESRQRTLNSGFQRGQGQPEKPLSSEPTTGPRQTTPAVTTPAPTSEPAVVTPGPRVDSQGLPTVSQRRRKGKGTQRSTTGTGQTAPPQTPSTASTSTPPASPQGIKSQPPKKKTKSSKLSVARARILELESRIASASIGTTSTPAMTS